MIGFCADGIDDQELLWPLAEKENPHGQFNCRVSLPHIHEKTEKFARWIENFEKCQRATACQTATRLWGLPS